jgi:hypothetical protein
MSSIVSGRCNCSLHVSSSTLSDCRSSKKHEIQMTFKPWVSQAAQIWNCRNPPNSAGSEPASKVSKGARAGIAADASE